MSGENLKKTGKEMEDLAAGHLTANGVRILERNFRSREAEIDLIGLEGGTLLFVEVKARGTGKKSGSALEAVGTTKQKRICRCADFYLHEKGIDPYTASIRFDVIGIEMKKEELPEAASDQGRDNPGSFRITWIRNAFPYIAGSRVKPRWRVW